MSGFLVARGHSADSVAIMEPLFFSGALAVLSLLAGGREQSGLVGEVLIYAHEHGIAGLFSTTRPGPGHDA